MAASTLAKANAICCAALSLILGNKVSYEGSPAYQDSMSTYFSMQQATTIPKCIIAPRAVKDVSTSLKTLAKFPNCQFAIRSGGHMSNVNSSSLDSGINIDLQGLDSVVLGADRSVVSVGPGAAWRDVYETLSPLGLTVAGGRSAGVGVGGLTLGGGISYLSPKAGFTCDTVRRFQVVLADGTVTEASRTKNADLWRALKGGSNNFGVVTQIDYEVYELDLLYGGSLMHPGVADVFDEQIAQFVKINSDDYDENVSLIGSWVYTPATGPLAVSQPAYTVPVDGPPAVYEGLLALPVLQSSVGLRNLTSLTEELAATSPLGSRQLYQMVTVKSTVAALKAAHRCWQESIAAVSGIAGLTWVVSIQPLPQVIYERGAGTNSFGFEGRQGNLFIVNFASAWTSKADDDTIYTESNKLMSRIADEARALDAHVPYIYLNYAGPSQHVIESYGAASVQRLRAVRKKYDPRGVFTTRVPGGFKIPS